MTTPGPSLFLTEIKVTDWSGMVRWYVEVLGLRLALEDPTHRYALLEAGAGRIALKEDGATDRPRDGVRLVFEVADADLEGERLARLGVAVRPPEDSPEGYRAVRLHDPEGRPITLFCWKRA